MTCESRGQETESGKFRTVTFEHLKIRNRDRLRDETDVLDISFRIAWDGRADDNLFGDFDCR